MKEQVLIVGAGPSGLVLALSLAKQQVPFRIIDKKDGPGEASRAMAVMPRTLEFYDQFGFVEEILEEAIKIENFSIYVDKEEKVKVDIGSLGESLSRFTSPFSYPQDEHERVLCKQLEKYGVAVEWNTELLSLQEVKEGMKARLFTNNKEEEAEFLYVCGCDGAKSQVRRQIQADFQGGTYEEEFYVMDLEAEGPPIGSHKFSAFMVDENFAVLLPVRSTNTSRAIGVIPRSLSEDEKEMTSSQLVSFMEEAFNLKISKVNWFSTYNIHHRVVDVFRLGRTFLVGDAAHIHSPAGGQGMNTGIGDAVNLGWKLAAVLQGRMKKEVLVSYEIERRAFAKRLVETTDRFFTKVVSKKWSDRLLRKRIAPVLIPVLFRSKRLQKTLFMNLSQAQIEYTKSPISRGKAGRIQAGKRLPYVGKNYEVLHSWDWQVHIYGSAHSKLQDFCQGRGLLLHVFNDELISKANGLKKDALYLVRPDGHVSFISTDQEVELLEEYLDNWEIIPFQA